MDFARFRDELPKRVQEIPGVEGLIWAGSSAEVQRADEWSDHDFFLMVASGMQEQFRQELTWLPASETIAWSARETAHGLKVVYQNGFVLEFAVFDREELSAAVVNHHSIAFGDDDLAHRVKAIHKANAPVEWRTLDDLLGIAYALLLIGAGRYLRGERLVGSQFVRSYAVSTILQCAHLALPGADSAAVDHLDQWRRVERIYPELAKDLDDAIALPIPQAAVRLGEVLLEHFGDHSAIPQTALAVLRHRLG